MINCVTLRRISSCVAYILSLKPLIPYPHLIIIDFHTDSQEICFHSVSDFPVKSMRGLYHLMIIKEENVSSGVIDITRIDRHAPDNPDQCTVKQTVLIVPLKLMR